MLTDCARRRSRAAYRAVPTPVPIVDVHVFPGVLHGYMLPGEGLQLAGARLLHCALAILDGLHGEGAGQELRVAS